MGEDLEREARRKAEGAFGLGYADEASLWLGYRVIRRKVIPVMLPIIKGFFYDETSFIRYSRAIILGLGLALHDGMIPVLNGPKSYWIGPVVAALSVMLGAGDRNRPPEEIKAIAEDPTIVPKP